MTHREELRFLGRFLLDVCASLCAAAIIVTAVFVASADPGSYAASLAKKEEVLKSAPSPKLVIVGGSGAGSSIDSQALGETTGRTPVNMGLYAGVGLRFALNQIKDHIKDRDLILIAPEYEMLQQPPSGDGHLLLQMLHENPSKLPETLTPRSLVAMIRAFPSAFQTQLRKLFLPDRETFADRLYRLENIDEHGDLDTSSVADISLSREELMANERFVRKNADARNLELLAEFVHESEAKGARVFVVMPAVPASLLEANRAAIESQHAELRDTVGDRIIGKPGDFIFSDEQFLDSIGHLTADAKPKRTRGIIDALSRIPL